MKFYLVNAFVGLVISSYFIYSFFYHNNFVNNLIYLSENNHTFFNRYTYIMAAYAFMRERILNNNSLDSYVILDPNADGSDFSPPDPDDFFRMSSL